MDSETTVPGTVASTCPLGGDCVALHRFFDNKDFPFDIGLKINCIRKEPASRSIGRVFRVLRFVQQQCHRENGIDAPVRTGFGPASRSSQPTGVIFNRLRGVIVIRFGGS